MIDFITHSFEGAQKHGEAYRDTLKQLDRSPGDHEEAQYTGYCRILDTLAADAASDLGKGRFNTLPLNVILLALSMSPERIEKETPFAFRLIDYVAMIDGWTARFDEMPVTGLVRAVGVGATPYEPWGLLRPHFQPENSQSVATLLRDISGNGIRAALRSLEEDPDPFRPAISGAGVQLLPLPFECAHLSDPALERIRQEQFREIVLRLPSQLSSHRYLAQYPLICDPSIRYRAQFLLTSDTLVNLADLGEPCDLLIADRFDPEILTPLSEKLASSEEFHDMMQAFNDQILGQIKDGGKLFLSVGTGNGPEGAINRILFIDILSKISNRLGKNYKSIIIPFRYPNKGAFWRSSSPWKTYPNTPEDFLFLLSVGELSSAGIIQMEVTPELRAELQSFLETKHQFESQYRGSLARARRLVREHREFQRKTIERITPKKKVKPSRRQPEKRGRYPSRRRRKR